MTAKAVIAEMRAFDKELAGSNDAALGVIRRSLAEGVAALSEATDWLLETYPYNAKAALAGAVPYLKLWGTVAGGWQLARGALIAKRRLDEGSSDFEFYRGKIATARFFAEHILPLAHAYRQGIVNGSASVLALEEAQF
jgi:acyl-CoA dehydrogenase